MGQITATRNLVATKVVRLAEQKRKKKKKKIVNSLDGLIFC